MIEKTISRQILIIQTHLVNNFEAKFGHDVNNKRVIKLPERFGNDEDVIDPNLQS
jgi:hypothetical protein